MGLHKNLDEKGVFIDLHHEDKTELSHRKQVRKMLEKRLEHKRLKEELEFFDGELDSEFDWNHFDK